MKTHIQNTDIPSNLQLLSYFLGTWSFTRTVSTPQITMTGQAHFQCVSQKHLTYKEDGTYQLGETEMTFHQQRFFKQTDSALLILKSDHASLHIFNLNSEFAHNGLELAHCHICNTDHYNANLHIHAFNQFSLKYAIIGPHKNYIMETTFSRE